MNYLIYVSTSAKVLNDDDLKQLLLDSRYRFAKKGITGMMLYSNGTFFQALEGDEEQLNTVFETLKTDGLQKGIIKLKSGKTAYRTFTDWTMGFKSRRQTDVDNIRGFVNPFSSNFLGNYGDQYPAVNLLRSFAQYNLQY